MANNNLFTLGLNVSATKLQMDKQLKQIAKELSDGKTVQVTGGLNIAQSQKLLQSQLNTISKNLKVGVQIDTTSIKQQTDAINRQLSSGINTTGVKVPFQFDLSDANAVKQEINKIVAEITNNQGKLVKYKIAVDENGQATRALLTYRNGLNEVTNATLKLKSVGKIYDANGMEHHIVKWAQQRENLLNGITPEHERSHEYASRIMEAIVTGNPFKIGGNVINNGLIPNLPAEACVEVPCFVDKSGITPTYVGPLPTQLAAMNSSNIYPQMLTIEAAVTGKIETLYQAAMMDPRTGMCLSTDEIVAMVNELVEAHTNAGYPIF